MKDTRGSTMPKMVQPIMAEQSGQIDYIKWFSELTNKDVVSAGGKGASLGEMFSNKFPVPPGYVITAQAYDIFLRKFSIHEKISEIISNLDVDDTAALNEASKQIRSLIENGEIPENLKEEILESYKILSSQDLGDISPGVNSDALSILKNSQEPIFVSVRSSATTDRLAKTKTLSERIIMTDLIDPGYSDSRIIHDYYVRNG
jgi:pyruvate,water dikinase